MPFQRLREAELVPGKLIRIHLENLPGKPAVWCEYMGAGNRTWVSEQILNSKATSEPEPPSKPMATFEDHLANRAANVAHARDQIKKHAVRKLEAFHDDGREATEADIPEFCDSLPSDAVVDLYKICIGERDRWRAVPKDDAEKVAAK